MLEGCDRVIRHLLRRQGTIDVSRATVCLHLEANHLPGLSQPGEHVFKGRADCGEGSVEQYKWSSFAVNLVVHVEAVDGRIPRAHGCCVGRLGHRPYRLTCLRPDVSNRPPNTVRQHRLKGEEAEYGSDDMPSTLATCRTKGAGQPASRTCTNWLWPCHTSPSNTAPATIRSTRWAGSRSSSSAI